MTGLRSHRACAGGSDLPSLCPTDLSPLFPHSFQGPPPAVPPPSFHNGPAGACLQIWEEATNRSSAGFPGLSTTDTWGPVLLHGGGCPVHRSL